MGWPSLSATPFILTATSSPVNPKMATSALFYSVAAPLLISSSKERLTSPFDFALRLVHPVQPSLRLQALSTWLGCYLAPRRCGFSAACLPSTSESELIDSTKLYVSGLSFRTTEESLRNAFQNFGRLVEVNLVMDRIANRPRGYAFLRYSTEEESRSAIEGMHGKFLDGRVIFVEICKPRSAFRQRTRRSPLQY